jgi:nucleoside-diphosphate-sugar epimerase
MVFVENLAVGMRLALEQLAAAGEVFAIGDGEERQTARASGPAKRARRQRPRPASRFEAASASGLHLDSA